MVGLGKFAVPKATSNETSVNLFNEAAKTRSARLSTKRTIPLEQFDLSRDATSFESVSTLPVAMGAFTTRER
jgi:hypothetical protein